MVNWWQFEKPVEQIKYHSFRNLFDDPYFSKKPVRMEVVEIAHGYATFRVTGRQTHAGMLCRFRTDALIFKRCDMHILYQLKPGTWIEVINERHWSRDIKFPTPYIVRSRAKHRKTLINDKR